MTLIKFFFNDDNKIALCLRINLDNATMKSFIALFILFATDKPDQLENVVAAAALCCNKLWLPKIHRKSNHLNAPMSCFIEKI